jgi:hypothetical protein
VPGDAAKTRAPRRKIKLPRVASPLPCSTNLDPSPSPPLPRQQPTTTEGHSTWSEDVLSSGLNAEERTPPDFPDSPDSTEAPVRRLSEPARLAALPPCKDVHGRRSFYDARDRLRNLDQLRTLGRSPSPHRLATRSVSPVPMRMSRLMRVEGERGRIPDEEYGNIFATGEEKAVVGFAPVRLVWRACCTREQ